MSLERVFLLLFITFGANWIGGEFSFYLFFCRRHQHTHRPISRACFIAVANIRSYDVAFKLRNFNSSDVISWISIFIVDTNFIQIKNGTQTFAARTILPTNMATTQNGEIRQFFAIVWYVINWIGCTHPISARFVFAALGFLYWRHSWINLHGKCD